MRTFSLIIIFLTFFSCGPGDYPDQSHETTTNQILDTIKLFDQNSYYDSANFHIIRHFNDTGQIVNEFYENKVTFIDSIREYYDNGQLRILGYLTNISNIQIKTWSYYSKSGNLDSTINFDKKYPISYFKALDIAKKKWI